MGYKRKRKTYRLLWPEGDDLHGLEVTVTGLSTEKFLEVAGLADAATEVGEEAQRLFQMFADALVGWNLEGEDDAPIPADLAGVLSNDFDLNITLIMAWLDAVGGMSGPLGQPSTSGSPSLEASLPMEPLSPSLVS